MKRGEPLKRTSGLDRSVPLVTCTGLERHTELPRTGAPLSRSGFLQRSEGLNRSQDTRSRERGAGGQQRPGLDRALSALVCRRDGGCVGCGAVDVRLEVHHRRRKGMGGSKLLDYPANLICLCGWGNHSGCHGWAHTWRLRAEPIGLVVPDGVAPSSWPVRYSDGSWWLLTDDGDVTATTDPNGGES